MFEKKTIFLADDDDDDQLIFAEALANIDPAIAITIACNGKDALEKLFAMDSLPDLIFLDINMPIMTGFECLRELKLKKKFATIPIVIYSTSASLSAIETAETLGAHAFLTKPDNHKNLELKLERILETDFSIPSSRIRVFSSKTFAI